MIIPAGRLQGPTAQSDGLVHAVGKWILKRDWRFPRAPTSGQAENGSLKWDTTGSTVIDVNSFYRSDGMPRVLVMRRGSPNLVAKLRGYALVSCIQVTLRYIYDD